MQNFIIFVAAGLLGFGFLTAVIIVSIALARHPYTVKDFVDEIREIFKAFYEGIKP